MKPEPAKFTRDNPCTKLHLWKCFRGRRGWKRVQVDQAHAVIGLNAPKYLLKKGYLKRIQTPQEDAYALTKEGQVWLDRKFKNYLYRHPEAVTEVSVYPKGFSIKE